MPNTKVVHCTTSDKSAAQPDHSTSPPILSQIYKLTNQVPASSEVAGAGAVPATSYTSL